MTVQIERELWCVFCGGEPFKESSDEVKLHTSKGHVLTLHIPNKSKYQEPKGEPREYENALADIERLEKIKSKGLGDNSAEFVVPEMISLIISTKHIVSKDMIKQELVVWGRYFGVKENWDKLIDSTWNDSEVFTMIKQICYKVGQRRNEILFAKNQLIELSFWLMGRYYIKRVELTGDLLFFNDEYYEKNAEALIRRHGRVSIIKSKSTDMNEIIKYIEDSCRIITSDDIESFVHLKCFLNGTFDIKKGEFVTTFSPQNIILNQIPRNYVKKGKFENIERIVSEIIPDKKDRQTYFDFGSNCLLPYSGIDFQLGLVGIPGTGKSKLAKLFRIAMGSANVKHAKIHSIAQDQTLQKDVAYCYLNIDEDMSSEDIRTDTLKKWITQEEFTGRSIYAHESTFRPTTRLMFCANGLYEIPNPDDALAIYERTHIIKLTQKFRGTEKEVKNIWEPITDSEFDEFISYLIRNVSKIYKNQNIKYPQSSTQTESLWNEYGNYIRQFIEEWVEKDPNTKQQNGEIHTRWLQHCIDNGLSPKGRNQFYDKFNEIIGSSPVKFRNGDDLFYGYIGIKLKTLDEQSEQTKIDQTIKGSILKLINKLEDSDPIFEELQRLLA